MQTRIWELFPALTAAIKASHDACGLVASGHSFDHPLRVGQMALELACHGRDDSGARRALVAGVAGLCHNADRVLQKRLQCGRKDVPAEQVRALVLEWLLATDLNEEERDAVVDAVVRHAGPNIDGHVVLMILQDADRLVNIMPDVVMRAGQFQPDIFDVDPVYLLGDPNASYFAPGSVLWDLHYMSTKWDSEHPDADPRYRLRSSYGIEIGRPYFRFLRDYVAQVLKCREDYGLVPYPQIFSGVVVS